MIFLSLLKLAQSRERRSKLAERRKSGWMTVARSLLVRSQDSTIECFSSHEFSLLFEVRRHARSLPEENLEAKKSFSNQRANLYVTHQIIKKIREDVQKSDISSIQSQFEDMFDVSTFMNSL